MAKKKINVAELVFKIGDDGTLKIFEGETKKAGKAVDKLGRSEQTLNRNFKGASRQSSNQTKNFSKMAQGITGGLVPAYATLAANIFAIGAAFRFLQSAADLRILQQGQLEYAQRTGQSLSILTRQLQAATDGQLAFAEAAQSVAIGTAAGLSAKQINQLGVVAKNASLMLGRDLTDSFNRLVRGAVKAEPELLDELGIILRLETAAENYANKLNLNAKQLNIFQKSQSVVNEVLEQGFEKFGGVETSTNELTKLAKAFDDLVNSLKRAVGPMAEFMATALQRNTLATAGMGVFAGTSVLKAITPSAPEMDYKQSLKDIRKFTTKGNLFTADGAAKFGDLRTEKELKDFELALSRKKSKFLDYTNFTKAEHNRMILVMKSNNLKMAADHGGAIAKMRFFFLKDLYLMEAEYGKFIGRMKFAQQTLIRGISFLGYAGLAISMFGIIKQFFDKADEAEQKYKAAQNEFSNLFQRNAEDLEKTIDNLKVHDSLMTNMLQTARALSNIDYTGISKAFDGGLEKMPFYKRFIPTLSAIKTSTTGELGVQSGKQLSKQQVEGLEGLIRILEAEQKVLIKSGKAYQEHAGIIETVQNALSDNKEGIIGTTSSYELLREQLILLDEEGTIASRTFENLGSATQILTSSTSDFAKALRSFKAPQTQLTRLTTNILQAGEALQGLGETYASGEADVKFNTVTGTLFDKNTQAMLDTFLNLPATMLSGPEKVSEAALSPEALTKRLAELQTEILGYTNKIESGVLHPDRMDEFTEKRAKAAGEVMRLVGTATIAEAKRLHDIEMEMIKDKTKVQKNLVLLSVGATKNQQKQLKMQGASAQNLINIRNQEILMEELEKKKLAKDNAQVMMEQEKLDLMKAQQIQLEKNLDTQHQIIMAGKNALESGLQSTFDDLLTGKNSSLSEGLANMAKGVFEGVSKVLSERMATGVTNFLFGNKELEGYQKGAEIIKQAHIEGISAGMGVNTGDISSSSGEPSGMARLMNIAAGMFGFSAAKGGISPVYAASGGVYSGSRAGYPAVLHGNEAVVPLPDGKSIPVSGGMGGNITVNVSANGAMSSTSDSGDMYEMGRVIAQAVQNEIENQQRPGGQLSPY